MENEPNHMTGKSEDERASQLVDELDMAIRWQRPCIIIIVYRSEIIRAKLQAHLLNVVSTLKQEIVPFRINNKQYDIPLILAQSPLRGKTVFAVDGLRWGGGRGGRNAYRALNLHREYLVDYQVRAIFWLTCKESRSLPRYAPDFWAFRHRVFEFVEFPTPEDIKENADNFHITNTLHQTMGNKQEDVRLYQEAISNNTKDYMAWCNLANTYHSMSFFPEALEAAHQATKCAPEKSIAWLLLGNIHYEMGCFEDAVPAYRRVIRLAPDDTRPKIQLRTIFLMWGKPKMASRYLPKGKLLPVDFDDSSS